MRDWQPIGTAPYDQEVEIRCGTLEFRAKLVSGGSLTMDGGPCDQWQASREGEHPPCWSDGACWASNVDEEPSLQPDGWRTATRPDPARPGGRDA